MSALLLRLIACLTMVIDHIGFQYNIYLFRCIGRIAFPIFVYLLCNGYRYTTSRLRYALRLGISALISQVPFSLFCYNTLWHSHGNVFVTLLLSLLCIWSADSLLQKKNLRILAFLPTLIICVLYYFGVLDSDYGIRGILFALLFYFVGNKDERKPGLLELGMLLSIYYPFLLDCGRWLLGGSTPILSSWDMTQVYSLCALPLIMLYNGQKGCTPVSPVLAKLTQLGFYAFYPAHMLILWLIRIL